MLTPLEEGDLFELLRSGVARPLRLAAGETLYRAALVIGVDWKRLSRWERGSHPQDALLRERYYRLLCEWRAKYGTGMAS